MAVAVARIARVGLRTLSLIAVVAAAACRPDSTVPPSGDPANPSAEAPDPWDDPEARAAREAMEAALPPPEPPTVEALEVWIAERARRLATLDYASYPTRIPEALRAIGYAEYRALDFRPEAALWRDEAPFELQLAHPGFLYTEPVDVHVVEGGRIDTLAFDADLFRYDSAQVEGPLPEPPPPGAGYAGLRIYSTLGREGESQEVAVFLGASYYRILGRDQVHGLSARGVAIDIAGPDGEEFPYFRSFWLMRPEPDARALTLFALLDSPSLTGAYRFDLRPDRSTEMEVDARLFARSDVGKLGVAPLTSMYLYGPDERGRFDDYRPRVHDSEGLLARTGRDEWIWRPLTNGPGLRVTSLRDVDPAGFGLVQRHRDFEDYLDLEALYHRRPSVWVEAIEGPTEGSGWGVGGVELVEIPSASEANDNIVASWVPDAPFRAGDARRYRYRLTTFGNRLEAQTLLQVMRSRSGWDALPGAAAPPPRTRRRFVVDFGGTPGAGDTSIEWPEAVVETTAGTVSDVVVEPIPGESPGRPGDRADGGPPDGSPPDGRPPDGAAPSGAAPSDADVGSPNAGGGWRVAFDLASDGMRRSDLRLYLTRAGDVISETWSYLWDPASIEVDPAAGGRP